MNFGTHSSTGVRQADGAAGGTSPILRVDWPAQCAAVIPCLNEAGTIEGLVRGVREHLPRVIVVDDGSTDSTAQAAVRGGAEVVRHPQTHGKGAALKTGWQHAAERGFAWVLSMDGDGQHAPGDIPVFFSCAEASGATLVIGNRMTNANAMPWVRRKVNSWMSRWLSRATGQSLPDSQCGMRLMQLSALNAVSLKTAHFEIESEQIVGFIAAGREIAFVPIQVIYKHEHSKIHPARDACRWLRWWKRSGLK